MEARDREANTRQWHILCDVETGDDGRRERRRGGGRSRYLWYTMASPSLDCDSLRTRFLHQLVTNFLTYSLHLVFVNSLHLCLSTLFTCACQLSSLAASALAHALSPAARADSLACSRTLSHSQRGHCSLCHPLDHPLCSQAALALPAWTASSFSDLPYRLPTA